jgi:hypothetical protein
MRASGLVAIVALVLSAGPARADDGRIEINQARALSGGVTPGDGPGFPVTISAPGSYVLTSNLTVPAGDGIVASVVGVAIDLNGFEVVGPVVCSGLGSAVSCSAGSGDGIRLVGDGSTVRDGRVRGFNSGVMLSHRAQVRQLIAESNRNGISVQSGSIVSESIAFQNGGNGFSSFDDSLFEASIASSNWTYGFITYAQATTSGSATYGSVAHDNGWAGIYLADASVVRDCSAYLNEGNGIFVSAAGLVSDSAAYQNGGFGIGASQGSTVQRNSVTANGSGLALHSSDASFRENTITQNGDTVSIGVDMGSNSCNGAPTCP